MPEEVKNNKNLVVIDNKVYELVKVGLDSAGHLSPIVEPEFARDNFQGYLLKPAVEKGYWFINTYLTPTFVERSSWDSDKDDERIEKLKAADNYFEEEEEAINVAEKMKAVRKYSEY